MPKRGIKKNLFRRGKDKEECDCNCGCHKYKGGACGVYFLGMIGAAVYYIGQSATFWQGVIGVLKAFVWPAFLVYKLLGGI